MKKLIVGNWKMNPVTPREARELYGAINKTALKAKKVEVVVCPPAIFLRELKAGTAKLGVQDIFYEPFGPFTGSISAPMAKYSGVEYIIVGHSERRAQGETDEVVNKKVRSGLKAGLKVILCIGETERDEHGAYLSVVKRQLEIALDGVAKTQLKNLVIAYEPVWAIGAQAKAADTPEAFHHNAIYIRKVLASLKGKQAQDLPILYGGSVNLKNAGDFLTQGQADGLLVGRESLNAKNFSTIITQAQTL